MASSKTLTKNSIYYLIYNVLNIIFPFLTGIYVARTLLPDSIGLVESAKNLVSYFVILSFLGIPTYGLREISKLRDNKKELNKVYSELLVINAISTVIFATFYLATILLIPIYRENLVIYLIMGILIVLNLLNNAWLYEGLEEFKYISIRNLIFKIISFVLLVIFVRNTNDYLIYAVIYVIGTAGNYLFNILHSRKIVKFSLKNLNLKKHMKSIMYLVFVNLAIEIYMLLDITMLGIICEKSNVAYYSYGIKIYRILLQIINTFTMVVVPRLSLLYKDDKGKFDELLTKTYKIILIIGIPLVLGIFMVSDYFICLLYGDAYITSSYVLKILSVLLIISPTGYLLGSRVMLITNNENKMVIPVASGAMVNIILNSILITMYKEIGAAIASVVSEICVMVIYIILSKKYLKLSTMKNTIKNITVSSAIMVLYLYIFSLFKDNLVKNIIAVIGAIIIYFVAMIILNDEVVISFYNKFKNKLFGGKHEKE